MFVMPSFCRALLLWHLYNAITILPHLESFFPILVTSLQAVDKLRNRGIVA